MSMSERVMPVQPDMEGSLQADVLHSPTEHLTERDAVMQGDVGYGNVQCSDVNSTPKSTAKISVDTVGVSMSTTTHLNSEHQDPVQNKTSDGSAFDTVETLRPGECPAVQACSTDFEIAELATPAKPTERPIQTTDMLKLNDNADSNGVSPADIESMSDVTSTPEEQRLVSCSIVTLDDGLTIVRMPSIPTARLLKQPSRS